MPRALVVVQLGCDLFLSLKRTSTLNLEISRPRRAYLGLRETMTRLATLQIHTSRLLCIAQDLYTTCRSRTQIHRKYHRMRPDVQSYSTPIRHVAHRAKFYPYGYYGPPHKATSNKRGNTRQKTNSADLLNGHFRCSPPPPPALHRVTQVGADRRQRPPIALCLVTREKEYTTSKRYETLGKDGRRERPENSRGTPTQIRHNHGWSPHFQQHTAAGPRRACV